MDVPITLFAAIGFFALGLLTPLAAWPFLRGRTTPSTEDDYWTPVFCTALGFVAIGVIPGTMFFFGSN